MADAIRTGSTSSSLIRGLQADDPEAWRRMAVVFGPVVYTWCRRAGLSGADVADVGQEVFLSVYRSVKGFRRERPEDTFHGWLWRIVRNATLALSRRQANEPHAIGGTDARELIERIPQFFAKEQPPQEAGARAFVLRQAMELLRDEFQEHTWQAFWRTAVDGQSGPDVADELGMSEVAVRNAKYRVLRRLRDLMSED